MIGSGSVEEVGQLYFWLPLPPPPPRARPRPPLILLPVAAGTPAAAELRPTNRGR